MSDVILEFIMKHVKAAKIVKKDSKEEDPPEPLKPNEIIELEVKSQ